MSKKTISQMEAILMGKINHAKSKLEELHQKRKLEIGNLAYKHNLQNVDNSILQSIFSKISEELSHEHQ